MPDEYGRPTVGDTIKDASKDGLAWGMVIFSMIFGVILAVPLALLKGVLNFVEGLILAYISAIQLKETDVGFHESVKSFLIKLGALIGTLALLEGLSMGILIYEYLYTSLGNEWALGIGGFMAGLFFCVFSFLDALIVRATLKDTSRNTDYDGIDWRYYLKLASMLCVRFVWLLWMPMYTRTGLALIINGGDIESHISRQEMEQIEQIKSDEIKKIDEVVFTERAKLEVRRKTDRQVAKTKFDEAFKAHQADQEKIRSAIAGSTSTALFLDNGANSVKKALEAVGKDDAKWLADNDVNQKYKAIDMAVNAELDRVNTAHDSQVAAINDLTNAEVAKNYRSDWVNNRTYEDRKRALDELGTSSAEAFLNFLMLAFGLMVFFSKSQASADVLAYFDVTLRARSGDQKALKALEAIEAKRIAKEAQEEGALRRADRRFIRAAEARKAQNKALYEIEREQRIRVQRELWVTAYFEVLKAFQLLMSRGVVPTQNGESTKEILYQAIIDNWINTVHPALINLAAVEGILLSLDVAPPAWPENSPVQDLRGQHVNIVEVVTAAIPDPPAQDVTVEEPTIQ